MEKFRVSSVLLPLVYLQTSSVRTCFEVISHTIILFRNIGTQFVSLLYPDTTFHHLRNQLSRLLLQVHAHSKYHFLKAPFIFSFLVNDDEKLLLRTQQLHSWIQTWELTTSSGGFPTSQFRRLILYWWRRPSLLLGPAVRNRILGMP